STYDADKVLVAVGREPVTDTLELDAVGLEPDEDGFLATDGQARTDVDHIFAVGDVAGEPMLAHKASKEGEVAAEVAAGEPAALDYQAVPSVVFTDPEIATVGMTEADAEDAGFDTVVGEMPFRASGRSLTTDNDDGFVRVVADADAEFVLGAQIVGPEASELVAEVTLAIELGATLEDVARTVHAHPTLSEAVMEAAENARGQAIHTLNR
ncbi:MAG: FAD-dependent oxidoreductase, partial [Halobacterium sp.]